MNLQLGGTVYPTGHEEDRCYGVDFAGVQVVITDASGADHAST